MQSERKTALAEMPNNAAAEKPGSAKNGNGAIVHGRRGSNSPAHPGRLGRTVHVTWTAYLLTAIHDVGYLVQMGSISSVS